MQQTLVCLQDYKPPEPEPVKEEPVQTAKKRKKKAHLQVCLASRFFSHSQCVEALFLTSQECASPWQWQGKNSAQEEAPTEEPQKEAEPEEPPKKKSALEFYLIHIKLEMQLLAVS